MEVSHSSLTEESNAYLQQTTKFLLSKRIGLSLKVSNGISQRDQNPNHPPTNDRSAPAPLTTTAPNA